MKAISREGREERDLGRKGSWKRDSAVSIMLYFITKRKKMLIFRFGS